MQYLVTGGAGFVGTAVVEALLRAGATTFSIDLIDYPPQVADYLASLPGDLRFLCGDARFEDLARFTAGGEGDIVVIHCAAHTPNPEGEKSAPRNTLIDNLDATLALLDFARTERVARTIYVSSGGVYGDLRNRGDLVDGKVDEDVTAARPKSLYAVAKHAGELAALRYRDLYKLPIHIARVGLVFGPWERLTGARQIVSAPHQIVSLARVGTPVVLERDSCRGWTSSRDMAAALVGLAAARQLDADLYNVATPHRWPLSLFASHLGRRLPNMRFEFAGERPVNAWLRFDFDAPNFRINRLIDAIGADALMSAEQSIEDYLDWVERFWSDSFSRLEA